MTQLRGRPPKGAEHALSVEGSDEAKERLALILRTVSGEVTVSQACAQLQVSEAHFHRLRERALQGAAAALESKPVGRPHSEPPSAEATTVTELQEQVRELELQLMASHVREELALVMPQVLRPTPEEARKKKRARQRQRRARRKSR
jgi:hypothetical protein